MDFMLQNKVAEKHEADKALYVLTNLKSSNLNIADCKYNIVNDKI